MKTIVFIGMPGCGKTTVSQEVAKRLNRPWKDCDAEIERVCGMGIPQIFETMGEDYFRTKETECLERMLKEESHVLATGGGAVLRNSALLRADAAGSTVVIYLYRSVPDILDMLTASGSPGDTGRPLLQAKTSEEAAKKLYATFEARRELYEKACHIKVEGASSVEETTEKVMEALKNYENSNH